jgi:hypothetical protein
MAVPGTGSTNQSLTMAASKKLAGKAHTSNQKEIYDETIPSNIQLSTKTIFAEPIPQTVSRVLYSRFSASADQPYTVEFVEFHVESISGTTYEGDSGSFGQVGFGGGDESQTSGPHGFKLILTSSYQSLSSGSWAGTGNFLNNKVINETNGGLQLVGPSMGPQTSNRYQLQLWTDHPDRGGASIGFSNAIDWQTDYFNGTIFVQDYRSDKVPGYARGFIYVGKYADTAITEASSSGGGGGISYSRTNVATHATASTSDSILGVNATASLEIRLPAASGFTAGQYFTIKDEAGNANTYNIKITASSADTIDGQSSIILESNYSAVNLYSNGSDKFFIY